MFYESFTAQHTGDLPPSRFQQGSDFKLNNKIQVRFISFTDTFTQITCLR